MLSTVLSPRCHTERAGDGSQWVWIREAERPHSTQNREISVSTPEKWDHHLSFIRLLLGDIAGGPVVKNLPCNAGDETSIPGLGTKVPPAEEQVSPRAITTDRRALEPGCPHERVCALQRKISCDTGKISHATTETRRGQIHKHPKRKKKEKSCC